MFINIHWITSFSGRVAGGGTQPARLREAPEPFWSRRPSLQRQRGLSASYVPESSDIVNRQHPSPRKPPRRTAAGCRSFPAGYLPVFFNFST